MDDQFEARQVDAAGGDVGRDADAGAPVAHRLQRVGALVLAEFAGQATTEKPRLLKRAVR